MPSEIWVSTAPGCLVGRWGSASGISRGRSNGPKHRNQIRGSGSALKHLGSDGTTPFHAKQNYSSNRRRSLSTGRCAIVASIEGKVPLLSWIRAMVFAMVPSRLGSASDFLRGGGRRAWIIALALRLVRFAGQTPHEQT
jgi:hypothetical protein